MRDTTTLDKWLPTFGRWLKPFAEGRQSIWELRGPTWYISTWFGDALATQQRSLLRVLAVAYRERMEFAPLVFSLAEEHRGRYRRRLRRLARRLAGGTPLVEALEQSSDALDDDTVLALRFGSQSGTLQAAFEMLLAPENSNRRNLNKNTQHFWVYGVVLAATIGLVLMFMMVVIAPTFKQMFEEFGMALPWTLSVLIAICNGFSRYAVLWVLLAMVALGLFWSSAVRRFFRRSVAPRFLAPLAQRRTAELLKLLAIGAETGRPLASALSTLARYHFDAKVRQQLLFARNEIEQGVDSWECLAQANLLTPQQSHALATAPNHAIRAWTLRRLAAGKQDSAHRRSATGAALLHPLAILLFAAVVMFIFVSFFSVLLALIHSLS